MTETTADKLEAIFDEIHAINAKMEAIPDLHKYGIPNDLNSATGREWEALAQRHDALAMRAARIVQNATASYNHKKEKP